MQTTYSCFVLEVNSCQSPLPARTVPFPSLAPSPSAGGADASTGNGLSGGNKPEAESVDASGGQTQLCRRVSGHLLENGII